MAIDSTTANAITEYKVTERKARQLLLISFKIRVQAAETWAALLAMAQANQTVGELYATQLTEAPGLEAALNAVQANLMEDWTAMLAMQTAAPTMFGGQVPPLPEVEEAEEVV